MRRFMVMHKADAQIEKGEQPTRELLEHIGGLIGEMAQTGAFLAGEGLAPTSEGVRLHMAKGRRTITYGPFVGENELPASFAIVRVKALDEAIDWASRIAKIHGDVDIYIGRVKEPWDLGLAPKPKAAPVRYMIIRRGDDVVPLAVDIQVAMRQLLSEMTKAGVLLVAERLLPSAAAVRMIVSDREQLMIDGPFTESKELIAGYSLIGVDTREKAVAWALRFADVLRRYAPVDSLEVDIRELAEGTGYV